MFLSYQNENLIRVGAPWREKNGGHSSTGSRTSPYYERLPLAAGSRSGVSGIRTV